jgi:type IV secretion system protein VirD4
MCRRTRRFRHAGHVRASNTSTDAATVAVVLAVGGIAAVIWIAAAATAAVTNHGVLHAGLGDALAAAVRLPSTFGSPADAWPPPARPQLQNPTIYWAATTLITAGAATLAAVIARVAGRGGFGLEPRHRLGVSAEARFATTRDLAPLIVDGPQPGRFILGRVGRRLVATEDRHQPARRRSRRRHRQGDRGAVALMGPSRSGKTTAAISGILEWDGPAVLASVKSDLMGATLAWRRQLGEVLIYDPTGATGQPPAGWTPLRDAATTVGAQRAARALVAAAPQEGIDGGNDFWLAQAEILLSGLLWVAASTPNHSMRDVVDWILTQDHPDDTSRGDVEPLLQHLLADPDTVVAAGAQAAGNALMAIWQLDERTRADVYATAQTVVWPWADPGVARSADRNDITLEWLLSGPNTLYLCAPIDDQRRLAPAFGGLLNDLIRQSFAQVSRTNRPLDTTLLLVIDEAGNTPLRSLPEYASTVAGIGILLVTIWQSKAQIDATYGRQSDTILTNHLSKVIYAGASDLAGLDLAARLLGDEHVPTRSRSTDLDSSARSLSETTTATPLAPAHVVRQMRPGDALLLHGTLPPVHLRTRPYYQDAALAARAKGPA